MPSGLVLSACLQVRIFLVYHQLFPGYEVVSYNGKHLKSILPISAVVSDILGVLYVLGCLM